MGANYAELSHLPRLQPKDNIQSVEPASEGGKITDALTELRTQTKVLAEDIDALVATLSPILPESAIEHARSSRAAVDQARSGEESAVLVALDTLISDTKDNQKVVRTMSANCQL